MKLLKFMKKKVTEATSVLTDEMLYNEIYSSQDELIKEANRVLNEPSKYSEERFRVLESLAKLGFRNAEQVKEFKQLQDLKAEQTKLKEKAEYYLTTYPNNKFITEKAVEVICKKYGLLLGETSDYISDIPEKNQSEIVNFKFKESDFRHHHLSRGDIWYNYYLLDRMRGRYSNCSELEEPKDKWIGAKDCLMVAPEHKFDMRNREKVGHTIKLKDPIVLQPVSEGFLIVSSWGLEASDPLVQNPKHN